MDRILTEGCVVPKSTKKTTRRYKCPYCDARGTRDDLLNHIEEDHEDLIPQGYTPARVLFNSINHKEKGMCICGCGRETSWNEKLCRYDRLTNDPKCKERYIKQMNAAKEKKYGNWNLAADPKFQEKMLKGRRISEIYTYSDGGKVNCVGSFERKAHEFLDKVMGFKSKDIVAPGPIIDYTWYNKKHSYISDIYIIPYNLIVEIKDGGDNPNTRPMEDYRDKQIAKEKQIEKDGVYNYVRVTNNQFDQLITVLAELKLMMLEDGPELSKRIVRINESMQPIATAGRIPILIHYQNKYTLEEGLCMATNPLMGRVFCDDGTEVEGIEKLKDCNYSLYLQKSVSKEPVEITFGSPMDLYKSFTGNELYSYDQIELDENLQKVESVWDDMHISAESIKEAICSPSEHNMAVLEQLMEEVKEFSRRTTYEFD